MDDNENLKTADDLEKHLMDHKTTLRLTELLDNWRKGV